LYLPADDSFLTMAREKHLIAKQIPLATMYAVVAVSKGNPKQITSLADLLKSDVRLVQANPDAAAIGKFTRATPQQIGQWEALDKATTAYRTTVNDVANDLIVVRQMPGLFTPPCCKHICSWKRFTSMNLNLRSRKSRLVSLRLQVSQHQLCISRGMLRPTIEV